MTVDHADRLFEWAASIETDGTPSQVGPTAEELRELAHHIRELEVSRDPWFGWSGGKCPLNTNIPVIVQWRNGLRYSGIAGGFQWHWGDREREWDIVAYCVPDPPPATRPIDLRGMLNAWDPETGTTKSR